MAKKKIVKKQPNKNTLSIVFIVLNATAVAVITYIILYKSPIVFEWRSLVALGVNLCALILHLTNIIPNYSKRTVKAKKAKA